MKRMTYFLVCIAICSTYRVQAQGFNEVSSAFGINMRNTGNSILGVGMSFADFDGDGWDDLTYCSSNDSLVMYRNLGGTGFERMEIFPFTHDSKMATWIDYDNDGDADLLWTKRSGTTRLFRNEGLMQFTDVTASLGITQNALTHIYGCAWGDFNRDGWLDVHICTYSTVGNSRNFLCRNNQDGTFTDVSSAAGVSNLGSLTFQSAWQDFNGDMWPDLYVINDNNESNKLYINNQDGTFADITASAGVATNVQSMNIGIADYDHDHDWDIYVTDAMDPNILWRNNGNLTFTNASAEANLEVNSFCWAGTWVDYDHDTWDDIYVATATNVLNNDFFYRNNGDGTFSDAGISSINTSALFTYAAGKGDFNNDGFWDLSVTCTGDTSYLLLQGIPNNNHWIKVDLEGTFSNRDAIGTHLDYYINGQRYIKYTRCGEDYLTQHSTREILSMGSATQIDSLIITWPRGLVEKIYNLAADQTYFFVEGENTTYSISAENTALCGDSLLLRAGDYASITWNDASTSDSLWVSTPGPYSVLVVDANGYSFVDTLEIVAGDFIPYDSFIQQPLCITENTGSASITSNIDIAVSWEHGSEGATLNDLAPGWYYFELSSPGFCSVADSIEIIAAPELQLDATITNASCHDSADGMISVIPSAPVDSLVWGNGIYGGDLTGLTSGSYSFTAYYNGLCTATSVYEVTAPAPLIVTIETQDVSCFEGSDGSVVWDIEGGTMPYYAYFAVLGTTDLSAGTYPLEINDTLGCTVLTNVVINEPAPLTLDNFVLTNANDGANGSIAVNMSGGSEPYSYLWSNEATGAENTDLAQGTYDLLVTDNNGCTYDTSFSILDVGIDEIDGAGFQLYPSPATDRINIRLMDEIPGSLAITDINGRVIVEIARLNSSSMELSIDALAPGTYHLVHTNARGSFVQRFIKMPSN